MYKAKSAFFYMCYVNFGCTGHKDGRYANNANFAYLWKRLMLLHEAGKETSNYKHQP